MLLISMFGFDDMLDCLATVELAFLGVWLRLYAIFHCRQYAQLFT